MHARKLKPKHPTQETLYLNERGLSIKKGSPVVFACGHGLFLSGTGLLLKVTFFLRPFQNSVISPLSISKGKLPINKVHQRGLPLHLRLFFRRDGKIHAAGAYHADGRISSEPGKRSGKYALLSVSKTPPLPSVATNMADLGMLACCLPECPENYLQMGESSIDQEHYLFRNAKQKDAKSPASAGYILAKDNAELPRGCL